jgi:hypothetical protein
MCYSQKYVIYYVTYISFSSFFSFNISSKHLKHEIYWRQEKHIMLEIKAILKTEKKKKTYEGV